MSQSQGAMKPEQQEPQRSNTQPASLWQPFAALRSEVDRLFDNFLGNAESIGATRGLSAPKPFVPSQGEFGRAVPAIDLVEAEKEFRIKAELPGMDAKDVELSLSEDMLTIKGEKKEEREEKAENYHLSERNFGSFSRSFQLPRNVDRERIEATFDKGVLTVSLPKKAEAVASQRKINIDQKT